MGARFDPTPRTFPPLVGRGGRARGRLLATLALGGFFLVAIALVAIGLSQGSGGGTSAATTQRAQPAPPPPAPPTTQTAKPKPAVAPLIPIQAIAAYDPAGDGHENDSTVGLATDGDLSTLWHTEHYRTWYKPGVGLVLDAGHPVQPTALTLDTDQPGFVAEVQAGSSPTGPFTLISQSATTNDTTVFRLRAPTPERYILLWITSIPNGGAADVNEVRLR
jgi:hypothetical protein